MKVAVSSTGRDLDSQIDSRFGRCAYFVVVDTDDMSFEVFENENIALGGGAGIQSSQFVASKGVKAVITGNCGPNAVRTLNAAGVEVITGQSGTVREAVERFKKGQLRASPEPNVPDHYGMRGGGSDLAALKQKVEELRRQIQEVEQRIEDLERKGQGKSSEHPVPPLRDIPEDKALEGNAIRIAVPVSGGRLNPHFGHSESFLIIDVENGQIKGKEFKTPPPHEPGVLPDWMAEQGVDVVITGGMGARALGLFDEKGIRVVTGVAEMDPVEAVQHYLAGTLVTGKNVCDH